MYYKDTRKGTHKVITYNLERYLRSTAKSYTKVLKKIRKVIKMTFKSCLKCKNGIKKIRNYLKIY